MSLLVSYPPDEARLKDLPANPSGFDTAFDLLAGLGEACQVGNAGDELDVARLADWQSFLAEFIWPDFESKPAAVAPFACIVFPARAWRFAAITAWGFLPDDIRVAIENATGNAVFVSYDAISVISGPSRRPMFPNGQKKLPTRMAAKFTLAMKRTPGSVAM
jgi:hypothetical protein